MKPISEYKAGDKVEVLMKNPQTNKDEWREAEIIDNRMIYPNNYSHHPPYPMLIIKVIRTYCKATPNYRYIDDIPVFINNNIEFYDKENTEGILYNTEIRPKEDK
jgi:hypothetical protein